MCFIPRNAVVIEFVSENSAYIKIEGVDLDGLVDLGGTDGIIEWGDNTYKVTGDDGEPISETVTFRLTDIKWVLFVGALACLAAHIAFLFAGKLCKCFEKCDTPFTEETSKGLWYLAWSLLPITVISSIGESVSESVMMGNLSISVSFDLTVVIAVLCIFMLSFIFKYGTALQAESDETL